MTLDKPVTIRRETPDDLPFLQEMLFEAFFWNPQSRRPPLSEFLADREFERLLADWGRVGDTAVIAQVDGISVGAAWYRFWTEHDHSYGFIAPAIPELGMAVRIGFRSRGIGRRLLQELVEAARLRGVHALSLSVDPHNYALRLYQSEGFSKVGESGTSWTLRREIGETRGTET